MKIRSIFFLFVFLCCFRPDFCLAADVSAESACVLEAQTGQILYQKNADIKRSMASTTKIMTALVAIELGNLTDVATVSENAAGTEGTSLYLKAGDTASLSDLLYGLMLQSGNDSAIVIAEHVGGSVAAFAEKMTEKAKAIGAKNTAFQNPNGLESEGHYTTATDLARITRAALQNETFAQICATRSKTILDGTQTVTNHNKLLSMYEGCVGVKTGYTKKAGRCLVSSAVRNGVQLICVTLNAPDDWNDHKKLLDEGFSQLGRYPILAKGMTVNTLTVKQGDACTVEVVADDTFYLTDRIENRFQNVSVSYDFAENITAPVTKGESLGISKIFYKDTLLGAVDLVAGADVSVAETKNPSLFWTFFKKLLLCSCENPQSVI